jgi:antirestriction protein ArdC
LNESPFNINPNPKNHTHMKIEIAQKITQKFIDELEVGTIPWKKPWAALYPKNYASMLEYKGINRFLLGLFGGDEYFLTYKQAQDAGGQVRKGSKGLPVLFYTLLDKKDTNKEEPEKIPLARYSTVFKAADIDGIKQKSVILGEHKSAEDLLSKAPCDISYGGDTAGYSPKINKICLPLRSAFSSLESFYAVAAHEIGHAMSAPLGIKLSSAFGCDEYAEEELIAELFSAFYLSECGIENNDFQNSAAYIQNWLTVLKKDPQVLIKAASGAQKRFAAFMQEEMGEEAAE